MQLNNPILLLRVVRFNDEPVAEPIAIEFGPAGGTIGRATDCTLVLPDQQRAISRVHARVEFRGGEYLLCDLGSNPSVLNQRALGGTREARLANGDRLMIGAYLLEVTLAEAGAGMQGLLGGHDPLAAAKVLGGPSAGDAQSDPFSLGALDPLGQPGFGETGRLSSRPGFAGSQSDHVSPELQAFAMPVMTPQTGAAGGAGGGSGAPAVPGGGIPADYDPLADALAQWEAAMPTGGAPRQAAAANTAPFAAAAPLAPGQGSAFAPGQIPVFEPGQIPVSAAGQIPMSAPGLAPAAPGPQGGGPTGLPASLLDDPASAGVTPFDDLFAPAPQSIPFPQPQPLLQPQPLPSVSETAPAPASRPEPVPAPAAASAMTPAAAPAAARPTAPAAASAMAPAAAPATASAIAPAAPSATAPAAAFEAPPAAPPATASATSPAPALAPHSDSATLAALLDGLGLDPARAPNLPAPEFARLIGAMLRESLRGTMTVLRSRSTTKREARLDTTLIVARDNNPLKFFPDVDSALAQMLTGRSAGYLAPDEALARAFADIQSHELAVIAGMRAALAHVLGRFEPAGIEARVKEQGVLDKVLSNRKAKLWDCFVELQAGIAREADDDFQKLFGAAFNEAYEAQIDALQAARKRSRTDPPDNT